ncbi:tryptophan 7-halogenase [Sinorhizobium sp. 8-89]|uniref:tryptophan 7-halogenase n=1 Tax=Sinorhizobium sp. 7-81 TaxID=3049087 RepID=UPI0024C29B4A|nr:tryptophan 7-halogenase [Sinorhizobium sp. 7-81]MDK1389268.1 tryptophan 7-halogenase [Sinorhizobium sp. 7-81]
MHAESCLLRRALDRRSKLLQLHYDGNRNDTPFWREITAAELPESYAELRACFQKRTPRLTDIQPYVGGGWQSLFHQFDWISVAAHRRVVPPTAARGAAPAPGGMAK